MTGQLNSARASVLPQAHCAARGMRLILSNLIFLCVPFSALDAQVPGGIRIPDGVGPLLVGFEEKVYRGEDNRILLSKGRKGRRKNLVYSIFVLPEHGQLKLHPELGVATYRTHPGLNAGVVEDRFEFRVREAGIGDKGAFSAAVGVNIKIADRTARLELPETIDFGEVVIGGHQSRELIIVNKGDADFSGKVSLPHGFQINGKQEVELNVAEGFRQSLMIRFFVSGN